MESSIFFVPKTGSTMKISCFPVSFCRLAMTDLMASSSLENTSRTSAMMENMMVNESGTDGISTLYETWTRSRTGNRTGINGFQCSHWSKTATGTRSHGFAIVPAPFPVQIPVPCTVKTWLRSCCRAQRAEEQADNHHPNNKRMKVKGLMGNF